MYCDIDFVTKKQMREYVKDGKHEVTVYQPGGMFPSATEGIVTIEGPHYPRPHKWYARVEISDGCVTRIIS